MGTKRGLERLIFFMDAVAAIAITLLILPLVDIVTSLTADEARATSPAAFLGDHLLGILAFVVSFVVIARLWISHHALFEHVQNYNTPLIALTMGWAFTIVLLPLPTALTYAFPSDRVTIGFYIGTMTVNSMLLTIMTFLIRRNAALESTENPVTLRTVRGSVTATGTFVLALVIGVVFPAINYFALFLFAVIGPGFALVQAVRHRLSAQREPSRRP